MPRIAKVNTYARIINASSPCSTKKASAISAPTTLPPIWASARATSLLPFPQQRRRNRSIVQTLPRGPCLPTLNEAVAVQCGRLINYMAGIYDDVGILFPFFSDVNTLLARSAKLLGEHIYLYQPVSPLLVNLLTQLNGLNIISADQTAMNDLAVNMWMVTKYWFDFDSSLRGRAKLTEDSKYGASARTLSLLRPYLPRQNTVPARPKNRKRPLIFFSIQRPSESVALTKLKLFFRRPR